MTNMNITDLNWLVTDQNFYTNAYTPYEGFDLVESYIREAHPEKYSQITVEDKRFPKEFSWMRVRGGASEHLYLWCIKPGPDGTGLSLQQRVAAVVLKPLAAVSDAAINTVLVPLKLALLIDRVVILAISFFLGIFIPLKAPSYTLTIPQLCDHALKQLGYFGVSLVRVCVQPIGVGINFFSPRTNFSDFFLSYLITDAEGNKEHILDQGRVKYLREHCGWEHVTDERIKSLNLFSNQNYNLHYFERSDGKVCIDAHWKTYINNDIVIYTNSGVITIPRPPTIINHKDANY